MPITGLIPQQKPFGEILATIPHEMRDQQRVNIAQQHANISRQAEARAQTIMPYLLQKYKDEHGRAADDNQIAHLSRLMKQREYDSIIKGLNEGQNNQQMPQGQQQGGQQGQPGQPGQPGQQGQSNEELANIMRPLMEHTTDPESINVHPHSMPIQGMEGAMQQRMAFPQGEEVGQNPEQMQQQQQMPQQQWQQNPQGMGGESIPSLPKEIVLRAGKPGMELSDRLAGTSFGKAPTTYHGKNGWIFTHYPASGKITAIQNPEAIEAGVGKESPEDKRKHDLEAKKDFAKFEHELKGNGESPEEKRQGEIDKQVKIAEDKENLKVGSKLQTSGRDLSNVHRIALEVKQMLEENPELTGWSAGLKSHFNASTNKKLGEYDSKVRRLQSEMSKYATARPGVGSLKWAERAKPNNFKQVAYNEGMIDSILEDAVGDYHSMANEYSDRLHKAYPVKLFGQVRLEKPNHEVISTSREKAQNFIKKHPDHKILD